MARSFDRHTELGGPKIPLNWPLLFDSTFRHVVYVVTFRNQLTGGGFLARVDVDDYNNVNKSLVHSKLRENYAGEKKENTNQVKRLYLKNKNGVSSFTRFDN